ncbi:MAG: hypothetical protein DMD94_13900 [Candidatus Rokuibacteriota bacterium]|nr:MAG: hypothetical protein DMD94_13900 [Candidatus Rokubacteria bacterium]
MTWAPTVWTGLNAAIGSCGINAISAPRIARMTGPFASSAVRSAAAAPSFVNRIRPPTMRPGGSTICKMARTVTLLPQPLSPTIPTTWPGPTSKLTPSTARTTPSSRKKCTRKSFTSRTGAVTGCTDRRRRAARRPRG